jgi:ABC-type polysaccharide transport system permease subunit
MDVTFMGAENKLPGRVPQWRYRYRPVLAVLLLPSLLLIGVFSYYPAVRSLIGGFYQWNGFSPPTYAGISQFRQYIQAPTFGTEAKNIAILVGGSILISLVSSSPRRRSSSTCRGGGAPSRNTSWSCRSCCRRWC